LEKYVCIVIANQRICLINKLSTRYKRTNLIIIDEQKGVCILPVLR
jgi:hypothetical protein